jgi:pimeloyl-ACP methyl ester carboxylesterase
MARSANEARAAPRYDGERPAVWNEARAAEELGRLLFDPLYYGRGVPRGDKRHVLVLPGLFANDFYLEPFHAWLRRIGYRSIRSTLRSNVGCPQRLREQIDEQIGRYARTRPGPIALIGHSRGGILARAIAAELQEDASHLILLGSPVGALMRSPSLAAAARGPAPANASVRRASDRARAMLDPDCKVPDCGCPFPADLSRPLDVSTRVLSIYSKDDPIVPRWACPYPGAENVEVTGTHSGLVYNRAAYRAIADHLADDH